MSGSGLFSTARAKNPSYVDPGKGALPGEVGDLRKDVASALLPLAAICVEEFSNPLATSASNVMAATTSSTDAVTLVPGSIHTGVLTATVVANMALAPRQLQFTTAGATPAHQPARATIVGTDERGRSQTEVVALKQTAGLVISSKFFKSVSSIALSAGDGAGATLAIGLGAKIGLSHKVVSRAGRAAVIQEVAVGSVVTNGTVNTAATGTSAAVTGTGDLSVGGTITALDTQTLIFSVDSGPALTVTFAAPADKAAVVAQINAVAPGIAALGGVGNNFLVLTSTTTGINSAVNIFSGTGLTNLGLTVAETKGVGNGEYGSYTPSAVLNGVLDFAVYYEYDPTV